MKTDDRDARVERWLPISNGDETWLLPVHVQLVEQLSRW
jgi:hypothetical protein